MNCKEEYIDLRIPNPEYERQRERHGEILIRLNQTIPYTEEYYRTLHLLFGDRIGEGSYVASPLLPGAALDKLKIGRNVFINSNLLAMSRGGITIEDDVNIAANVCLLSNNHDPYDREVIRCRPIHIQKGAWIGANATILAGVSIGKHSIVGAGAVVTKDVPNYAVVVGNPARVIKTLDASKFSDERE